MHRETNLTRDIWMNKLLPLESLRGIAALTVVIHHFEVGSHFNNVFTQNGWLMVDFFFVLSGFVIFLNYGSRISNLDDIKAFQIRRFQRLYPLHLLMLMVFLGIELAKFSAPGTFLSGPDDRSFAENNLASFAANLFLVQNWIIERPTFNYPSWSISAEFYTYAIFALLIWLVRGKGLLIGLSLLLIALTNVVLQNKGMYVTTLSGPTRCLFGFFIGVVCCLIFERIKDHSIRSSAPAMFLLLGCILCISLVQTKSANWVTFLPLLFGASVVCVSLTHRSTWVHAVLSNRHLVFLGTISYGIYMIHAAVLWIELQILRVFFQVRETADAETRTRIIFDSIWIADLATIFAVGVTVFLASVSYFRLERPLHSRSFALRSSL